MRLLLLSRRQRQVLTGLAAGQTVKSLAHSLGITTRTVQLHLFCARERLRAANNEQAVYCACLLGLLPMDGSLSHKGWLKGIPPQGGSDAG